MIIPDYKPVWVPHGKSTKRPFICLKDIRPKEEQEGGREEPFQLNVNPFLKLPPMFGGGGFFFGEEDDGYNKTRDRCREEWVTTSRYFDRDFCMKYFPQEMTFVQGKKSLKFFT